MSMLVSKRFDCRGKDIFYAVLHLRKQLKPFNSGEVLELLTDDPAASLDVQAWSKLTGHTVLRIRQRENYQQFYIQKSGAEEL